MSRVVVRIVQIDMGDPGTRDNEREISKFYPGKGCQIKHLDQLEDLLNSMSDEQTSFEVLVQREDA